MALMSYIIRDRHRTYYFRRVIPVALRGFMPEPWTGKANWKKSLGTKDGRVARREAAKCLGACEADFEAAERAMQGKPPAEPTPPQSSMPAPEEIEADEMARLLAEDEAERSDGDARRQFQTEAERAQWPDLVEVKTIKRHMEEDHFLSYGEQLRELATEYRKAAARSDVRIVHAAVRGYLRAKGLPIVSHSPEYHQAALAVLRAHTKAHDLMLRRQEGEVIPTPPRARTVARSSPMPMRRGRRGAGPEARRSRAHAHCWRRIAPSGSSQNSTVAFCLEICRARRSGSSATRW